MGVGGAVSHATRGHGGGQDAALIREREGAICVSVFASLGRGTKKMPVTLSAATLSLMKDDIRREQLCDWLSCGKSHSLVKILRQEASKAAALKER